MPEQNNGHQYKTSPKIAFIMGALGGIALISVVGFILSLTVLKPGSSTNSNSGASVNTNTTAQPTNTNTVTPDPPAAVDLKVTNDDHIKGDKNAKVTLVEYSDFECSYCSRHQTTIDQIMNDYKGKVRLVYRHFPLSFHENAQKAAEASECASEQGKFWEMHDKLFANQSDLSVDNYKKWAKELGLNTSKFNDCLDTGKYTQKVKDQETAGQNYGIEGTPANFVNGKPVVVLSNGQWSGGALPYETFKTYIDNALAGQ